MKKKLFFMAASLLALTACNNSGKGSNNGADTMNKMMSDTSHNMSSMTNSNVPEVPAVPEGAKVFFKNVKEGTTVNSPFKVEMGVDKMKVDTSGPIVAGSGHFHIFIDAEDSLAWGTVVPTDSLHHHYGKAQTETELTLKPGKHKLTLQFADGIHRSYGNKLATTVTVNVKK